MSGVPGVLRYSSTVQYSTVQYSTVQYSTVQYSTVQYSKYQKGSVNPVQAVCHTPVLVPSEWSTCTGMFRLFGRTAGDVTVLNVVVPIHVAAMMTCKFTRRRNLTFSSLILVDMLFNLGSR